MTLPAWLQAILPGDTATTWETLAPVIPAGAHLVGVTAVAVPLRHRISHDLDFFLSRDADLDVLRGHLERLGSLAVADHTDDTLNGLFEGTRLRFLDARSQRVLECPLSVDPAARNAAAGSRLPRYVRYGEPSRA